MNAITRVLGAAVVLAASAGAQAQSWSYPDLVISEVVTLPAPAGNGAIYPYTPFYPRGRFLVRVTLRNIGGSAASNPNLSLNLPGPDTVINGISSSALMSCSGTLCAPGSQTKPLLPSGQIQATWDVTLGPKDPGVTGTSLSFIGIADPQGRVPETPSTGENNNTRPLAISVVRQPNLKFEVTCPPTVNRTVKFAIQFKITNLQAPARTPYLRCSLRGAGGATSGAGTNFKVIKAESFKTGESLRTPGGFNVVSIGNGPQNLSFGANSTPLDLNQSITGWLTFDGITEPTQVNLECERYAQPAGDDVNLSDDILACQTRVP